MGQSQNQVKLIGMNMDVEALGSQQTASLHTFHAFLTSFLHPQGVAGLLFHFL
jgi:hypothetical protein